MKSILPALLWTFAPCAALAQNVRVADPIIIQAAPIAPLAQQPQGITPSFLEPELRVALTEETKISPVDLGGHGATAKALSEPRLEAPESLDALYDRAKEPKTAGDAVNAVGFFPSLGSRDAYRGAGRALWETASHVPEVRKIYLEGAEALGMTTNGLPDPTKLLFLDNNIPKDHKDKEGFMAAAFVIHNLAIEALLRIKAEAKGVCLKMVAYAGESAGIWNAAIASGALSVGDGAKIARFFPPAVLREAEKATPGRTYYVISLQGQGLEEAIKAAAEKFQDKFEIHKFYSNSPRQVNVYVADDVYERFKAFLRADYPDISAVNLKGATTTFITHSAKVRGARLALSDFIEAEGIKISAPRVPILSNSNTGILTSREDVLNALLATVDEPMHSMETTRLAEKSGADVIIGLGRGRKIRDLIEANRLKTPYMDFAGEEFIGFSSRKEGGMGL